MEVFGLCQLRCLVPECEGVLYGQLPSMEALCFQHHTISRLPDAEGDKPAKKKFKKYPIGYFPIDMYERGKALPLRCHRTYLEVRFIHGQRIGIVAQMSSPV